jgi:hypothetical protein
VRRRADDVVGPEHQLAIDRDLEVPHPDRSPHEPNPDAVGERVDVDVGPERPAREMLDGLPERRPITAAGDAIARREPPREHALRRNMLASPPAPPLAHPLEPHLDDPRRRLVLIDTPLLHRRATVSRFTTAARPGPVRERGSARRCEA